MIESYCKSCNAVLTMFEHTCQECGGGNIEYRCTTCGRVLDDYEMQEHGGGRCLVCTYPADYPEIPF